MRNHTRLVCPPCQPYNNAARDWRAYQPLTHSQEQFRQQRYQQVLQQQQQQQQHQQAQHVVGGGPPISCFRSRLASVKRCVILYATD